MKMPDVILVMRRIGRATELTRLAEAVFAWSVTATPTGRGITNVRRATAAFINEPDLPQRWSLQRAQSTPPIATVRYKTLGQGSPSFRPTTAAGQSCR